MHYVQIIMIYIQNSDANTGNPPNSKRNIVQKKLILFVFKQKRWVAFFLFLYKTEKTKLDKTFFVFVQNGCIQCAISHETFFPLYWQEISAFEFRFISKCI